MLHWKAELTEKCTSELPREDFHWGYMFAQLREYGMLCSVQTASVTDTKLWRNTREGVEKRLQRDFGW